jgi:hypothetical protein
MFSLVAGILCYGPFRMSLKWTGFVLGVFSLLLSGRLAAHPTINLEAVISPANVAPPFGPEGSPAQSIRTGSANFAYNPNAAEGGLFLSYSMQFPGLDLDGQQTPDDPSDDVISIQFRLGGPGSNGVHGLNIFGKVNGVVRQDDAQMLSFPQDDFLLGKWDDSDESLTGPGGTRTEVDSVKLSAVLEDLLNGRIYLQVTTKAFPSGELRGQITNPPPLLLPVRLNDGSFQLTIDHKSLREYRIEHTSDFNNWTSLTNIYALQKIVRTVDFGAATADSRFYRIRQLVILPLHIDTQPQSQTPTVGQDVNLTVSVSGTEPITYQWHRDGLPIDRATNSGYTITNGSTGDSGGYQVVITNPAGSETSATALVTINP